MDSGAKALIKIMPRLDFDALLAAESGNPIGKHGARKECVC